MQVKQQTNCAVASKKYCNAIYLCLVQVQCKCMHAHNPHPPAPPLLTKLPLEGSTEVIGELLKGDCRLRLRDKIKNTLLTDIIPENITYVLVNVNCISKPVCMCVCMSVCMCVYLPSAGLGLVAGLPEGLPPDLPLELRLVTNTSTHLSKNWATTWNKQHYM